MGLFSDIYNTVAKFFRPQEEPEGEASKSVATNRLKLVLMQDRTNLTPRILEQMRSELIDLLSRYVELDKELLELNFEQEGDQVALMLSIPVIRAKDEEEIEAAIKAHQEEMEMADDSEEEETDNENESEEDEDSESVDVENDEEIEDSEEENNEIIDSEEEIKPKKKKKKTVSTPEEMNSKAQEEENAEQTEEIQG